MRASTEIPRILGTIDWDFPRAATGQYSVHALHWFPGNYIPQIPSFLIEILSRPGHLVADPFCGSGTTGIEAIKLSRRSWMGDANPASIQVARGKVAALSAAKYLGDIEQLLQDISWEFTPRETIKLVPPERREELGRWIHPLTLDELSFLWSRIQRTPTPLRPALEMLFTDVLFSCASPGRAKTKTGRPRRHHWGWIADNVRPKALVAHDAIEMFKGRVLHLMAIAKAIHAPSDGIRIEQSDARELPLRSASVDLVVTSPPYLAMIDYTRANRLTFLWMGWPLKDNITREIGARCQRYGATAHQTYITQMTKSVSEIYRVLKRGAYCAIVIGASRIYPRAAEDVIAIFQHKLRVIWGPQQRRLSRRRISDRTGTESPEYVVVFEKC